ncbi:MAG: GTP 3',8-cyclase MoaA [Verrucomicrobia bacterium]|nr:GTP 3',8-cyclase MoaA [Verrucomicrobiota bacterium]
MEKSESPPQQFPLDQRGRALMSLRLSLIDRCNFRCRYCMPAEVFGSDYPFLPPASWMNADEILRLVGNFLPLGVTRLRLTGGEPLLRPGLSHLIERLAGLDGIHDLALTTNGTRLAHMAGEMRRAGLERITISLDSLDENILRKMSGESCRMAPILQGIDEALAVGFQVKLNAVIMRHINQCQILPLVDFARERHIQLRFIEFMDVGNHNHWDRQAVVPDPGRFFSRIQDHYPLESRPPQFTGEVAQRYFFVDKPTLEIGFVSSVTMPFCRDCNRARISSDGKLFTCLFAGDGLDLLSPMRNGSSDKEIQSLIRSRWLQRGDRYSEIRAETISQNDTLKKVEMSYIGG